MLKRQITPFLLAVAATLLPRAHLFAEAALGGEEGGPNHLELSKIFASCPIIYSILIALSIGATTLFVYSLFTLQMRQMMPGDFIRLLRHKISQKQFEEALEICHREKNFASSILASGIDARAHGLQVIIETIQAEGERAGNSLWQRIGLLNEIAALAPMFGLLGTVLGLFFAFYDTSAASDNLASIFDGLGIAVGTTVMGLIVAITATIFYTALRYRVVNLLNAIENESLAIASMIQAENNS